MVETVMEEIKEGISEINKSKENENTETVENTTEKKVMQKTAKKKITVSVKIEGGKSVWENILKRIRAINSEVIFEISKKGLHIRECDVAHVSMVDMVVPKSVFDGYDVSHDLKIGIDLDKFATHLKIFKGDVVFNYDGHSKIVLEGDKGKNSKMAILSVTDTEFKVPEIQYGVEIKTRAEHIKSMISVGEDFNEDALKFAVKDKMFHIFIESETDEVRFPICAINTLSDGKNFFSLYSIDYLKALFNFTATDNVVLKFGKDIPMLIEHSENKMKTQYLLSPRIEQE